MSSDNSNNPTGLSYQTKDAWPKLTKAQAKQSPIDMLGDKVTHDRVLTYLNERLKKSELSMSRFYGRWRVNEMKYQAFIDLPDWEKELKNLTDKGAPPKAVSIVIPYSFATISTVVTYLIQTFAGRIPILPVSATKKEYIKAATGMEAVLQYNSDHTKLITHLFQFLNDVTVYGVGVMRCQWKTEEKMRTLWKPASKFGFGMLSMGSQMQKTRQKQLVYEGNDICSIDPFMFFPDPRVPMAEVNKRGEYAFWRTFEGKHFLLKLQADGDMKYVDKVQPLTQPSTSDSVNQSARGLLAGAQATAGFESALNGRQDIYQMDQGTIEIIPAELGIGTENTPKKYLFTWLNRTQIVQCEPFDTDHDMHPVVVSEPYSMGYGFGQPGLLDYMGPLQDLMSWLVNSHIDNVRSVMNNMLIVDPSRIEMQDLKEPGAGKLVRLKRAAYGTDVNAAVKQLEVMDVTGGHIGDFEQLMKLADMMGAVSDNLRGQQDNGGRKTATEVRTAADAGTSRLAMLAKRISAQGITCMSDMMSMNIQQFLSDEFYIDVMGQGGAQDNPLRVTPEMLVGDFNFPVHDGTLPADKVAMLDVWKEILMGIMQDPSGALRQQFNIVSIFKYVAQLGGAKNIDQFINQPGEGGGPMPQMNAQVKPDEEVANQAQKGNMVPIPKSGTTPGMAGPPAMRI